MSTGRSQEDSILESMKIAKAFQEKQQAITFLVESNRIENIHRRPTHEEVFAHLEFMKLSEPTVEDLVKFVKVVQPDACLRDSADQPNVIVGTYRAPESSPDIRVELEKILRTATDTLLVKEERAYLAHVAYERLHPFTDGNGRSGRMLWMWVMQRSIDDSFLRHWYYQTLKFSS